MLYDRTSFDDCSFDCVTLNLAILTETLQFTVLRYCSIPLSGLLLAYSL